METNWREERSVSSTVVALVHRIYIKNNTLFEHVGDPRATAICCGTWLATRVFGGGRDEWTSHGAGLEDRCSRSRTKNIINTIQDIYKVVHK